MPRARYDVSATQAFNLLRRLSSEQQHKVVSVAEDLSAGHHEMVSSRQLD